MEGSVYLKARQEWDERYADLVLGKRNWQIAGAHSIAVGLIVDTPIVRARPRRIDRGPAC